MSTKQISTKSAQLRRSARGAAQKVSTMCTNKHKVSCAAPLRARSGAAARRKRPIIAPAEHNTAPVVHIIPPVVHSIAPVVHNAAPVVHNAAPVVHIKTPVVAYYSPCGA